MGPRWMNAWRIAASAMLALSIAACVSQPQAPQLYQGVTGWRPIDASEAWVILPPRLEESVIARLGQREGARLSQRIVLANDTVLEGENFVEAMMSGDPADRRRPFTQEAFLGTVSNILPGGSTTTGQTTNTHGTIVYALAEGLDGTRCVYAVQRLLNEERMVLPIDVEIAAIELRYCAEGQTRSEILAPIEALEFNPLLTVTAGTAGAPAF